MSISNSKALGPSITDVDPMLDDIALQLLEAMKKQHIIICFGQVIKP